MTIAITVQVNDGVVLASDSASTLTINPIPGTPASIINVYNNANKIFNLRKGLPIGGMTYGMGSFGSSSVSTLAKDLRERFSGRDLAFKHWQIDDKNFDISDIAKKTKEFFFDEKFIGLNISSSPGVQFGFIVSGFSSSSHLSETWVIEIADGQCAGPRPCGRT